MALSVGTTPVSLTASSGGIFAHFAATFSASQLTLSAAGAGQTIHLASSTGNITVNNVGTFNSNTQNDHFVVETGGAGLDISFTGATLTGSSVSLAASGDITTNSTTAIANTSAASGNITLIGASLGTAANTLRVNPGNGNLALMASR